MARRTGITVVLADGHACYRRGLARAIAAHPGLELVGEAESGPSALAMVLDVRPDVAVLDVRLPELDGLAVAERIAAQTPPLPTGVVLLSAVRDRLQVERARGLGALAVLRKEISRAEICRALTAAGGGVRTPAGDAAA